MPYSITRQSAELDLSAIRAAARYFGTSAMGSGSAILQTLTELADSIEEQVEASDLLRAAAERLIDMLDTSPETAAFIASRYPGLDFAFDLVRRNLPQTDDGAAAPGGTPGSASALGPAPEATPTAAPSSPARRLSDLIWSAVFWAYGKRTEKPQSPAEQAAVRTEWLRRARDERG